MATTSKDAPIRLAVDDLDLIIPLRHASGDEAVKQGCDARLRLIRGEVFWDLTKGVPWFENDVVSADEAILGQVFNEAKARARCREAIIATPNTDPSTLVMTVAYNRTAREMTVDWEIDTIYGDTVTGSTTI